MALTDTKIKNAKPEAKPYKLGDTGGLYLLVNPSGSKYWRYKYRFGGKEKTLAIGVYPTVTLKDARAKHMEAREHLINGTDPGYQKKVEKRAKDIEAENSFKAIGTEWFDTRSKGWGADHTKRSKSLLEKDIYPKIGFIPVNKVAAPDVLDVVRAIEARGSLSMAEQALSVMGNILRYAVGTGRAEQDVSYGMGQFLQPKTEVKHHRHVSDDQLAELLISIDAYGGRPETKIATKLMVLTFLRSAELRNSKWEYIQWDKNEWHVPSQVMKGKLIQKASGVSHIVPLCRQAVDLLKELHTFTGRGEHLFPSIKGDGKVMSNGTINKVLKIIGFHAEQTTHGFRGLASTLMNEKGRFHPDVIERQLSHKERNKIRRAYDHSLHLEERHRLMQWWGDYLDSKLQSNIIPFPAKTA
ncbi:MAG: integrase arm-type DNA-binding domain-containing protein [Alcaligenaceae bacterium]|nr:integrase arm-type DNA-binding domain-containing protein [Alcaligenaceae bacterium]